jgi:predicted RNase H-like nuclease (RuvC/YqgF family)
MTKTDLQKELLEKVKPGTKPSDIKRGNVKLKSDKDDGYSSGEDNIPKAPPLPNNSEQSEQIKTLQRQLALYKEFKEADLKIKEKYKETIKDLEAENQNLNKTISCLQNSHKNFEQSHIQLTNQLIAEQGKVIKLQTKITEQDKTIGELKNQDKNPVKSKGDPIEVKELFTCYHCKNQQEISLLVLELPEGKLCQPC